MVFLNLHLLTSPTTADPRGMSCQSNSGVLKSEDIAAVAQELGKDLSPEELAYVATCPTPV